MIARDAWPGDRFEGVIAARSGARPGGVVADETGSVPISPVGRLRYCASHSRWFWVASAPGRDPGRTADHVRLTNPKADEREIALDLFESDPALLAGRHRQTLLADKGYRSAEFERRLADLGIELVRPSMHRERPRRGEPELRSLRQIIESINHTLKSKLSLEHHGGHTQQGVATRIVQRLLALTAAIWHNHHTDQPVLRSLVAYDH